MSFWNTSTGESAYTNETSYESSPSFEPFADGTRVLAAIDSIAWKQVKDGYQRYISVQWSVVEPEALRNRKVFQSLWVSDLNPQNKNPEKKKDRDLRMLSAMDANAGGKLARCQSEPTDDELAFAFTGKMMVITIGLFVPDGRSDGGPVNFIRAVADKSTPVSVPEAQPQRGQSTGTAISDQIPF